MKKHLLFVLGISIIIPHLHSMKNTHSTMLCNLYTSILQHNNEFNYSCPLNQYYEENETPIYRKEDFDQEKIKHNMQQIVSYDTFTQCLNDMETLIENQLLSQFHWLDAYPKQTPQQRKLIYDTLGSSPYGIYGLIKIVPEDATIIATSDIHGNVHALLRILHDLQHAELMDAQFKLNNNTYIVFNGDIIDRGHYSVEALTIVWLCKLINPDHVIINQGNHENPDIFYDYGLRAELASKFAQNLTRPELLKNICDRLTHLFSRLQQITFIGTPQTDDPTKINFIQYNHGGLPSHATSQPLSFNAATLSPFLQATAVVKNYSIWYAFSLALIPKNNGLIWDDFFAGSSELLQKKGRRNDTVNHHGKASLKYLQELETIYTHVSGIIRGHTHLDHGINQLCDYLIPPCENRACQDYWMPIKEPSIIKNHPGFYPVFTITCMPEEYYKDAFVVITYNSFADAWQLTPYCYERTKAADLNNNCYLRWNVADHGDGTFTCDNVVIISF